MSRHLATLRNMAHKRTIKQFASKHHFVYFGYVDARNDEHELVRGLTVSTTHQDNHYTVGTALGHDITLVERRNLLTFPGKPDSPYTWLIMEIDLKRGGLPHVFIDTQHHDATFYANLAVGFAKLQNLPIPLGGLAAGARALAPVDQADKVHAMFPPEVATTISHQFKHFDYEINDDQLYIYASNQHTTSVLLDDMLRIGTWLANHLDAVSAAL